ncbi:peptidase S24/S26A/S26B/S26C family protein [Actinidia rufa]|uniref:Peptidase S24/S26A/S26B/S26C family protein n=1 Tax=Actinidia rufa TaxID=165716 RepID=A0A7J0HBF1_9ERIC|nr:peptidase S24/S26A/S26B/S26C family protein [Actinidia rufa]
MPGIMMDEIATLQLCLASIRPYDRRKGVRGLCWRGRIGGVGRRVFVGDVVVLKDPEKSKNYLVRRLAAIEGFEMVSTDEKEEPFVLDKDECWVLADNENLKPKEANDSRIFGPVPMTDIVGRVIYYLKTAVDHGPVQNSHFSMRKDSPVLEVELDVDEMAKGHKA